MAAFTIVDRMTCVHQMRLRYFRRRSFARATLSHCVCLSAGWTSLSYNATKNELIFNTVP